MDITEVQVVKFEFCPCLSLERNNKISKPIFFKGHFRVAATVKWQIGTKLELFDKILELERNWN